MATGGDETGVLLMSCCVHIDKYLNFLTIFLCPEKNNCGKHIRDTINDS